MVAPHTTEILVKKAKSIHGNKYDYSEVVYKNLETPVRITCKKHGPFNMRPVAIFKGGGTCPECTREKLAYTTKDFVKKAKSVHGSKFDYSKVEYKGGHTKVEIICKKHGSFLQDPASHLTGIGCIRCQGARDIDSFILKAKEVHGNKFDYSKSVYVNAQTKIEIVCPTHGSFWQSTSHHLTGHGCDKCGKGGVYSKTEFVQRAKEVHGDLYSYRKVVFVNNTDKVEIVCKEHGPFFQAPTMHLRGNGCPACCTTQYSKIAVQWVEYEAKRRRMKNVQHALNGGEFRIPGLRMWADGYHAPTKTIFEFHGDAYHGNPSRYKPRSKPHPYYRTVTAKTLYTKTMKREELLRQMGYRVISIWESEFREILKTLK